jgi:GTP-binding protein HflX
MSARRPDNVAKLHQKIVEFFQQDLVETEIFLPWTAQQLRGEIYANCQVLEERSDNDGAFFRVRSEPDVIKNIREQCGVE